MARTARIIVAAVVAVLAGWRRWQAASGAAPLGFASRCRKRSGGHGPTAGC